VGRAKHVVQLVDRHGELRGTRSLIGVVHVASMAQCAQRRESS
jgi:hypothetical protein